MINWFFFRLVDFMHMIRPKDWTQVKVFTYCGNVLTESKASGTKLINYIYNGRLYSYIGDKLPTSLARGFFLPIKSATWNGKDVTGIVKQYAGPRQDFFGKMPETSKMFYQIKKRRWVPHLSWSLRKGLSLKFEWLVEYTIEPEEGVLDVKNILGQSILGAK